MSTRWVPTSCGECGEMNGFALIRMDGDTEIWTGHFDLGCSTEDADEFQPLADYLNQLEGELRSLRAEVGMLRNQRDGSAMPPSDRQREQRLLYGHED